MDGLLFFYLLYRGLRTINKKHGASRRNQLLKKLMLVESSLFSIDIPLSNLFRLFHDEGVVIRRQIKLGTFWFLIGGNSL